MFRVEGHCGKSLENNVRTRACRRVPVYSTRNRRSQSKTVDVCQLPRCSRRDIQVMRLNAWSTATAKYLGSSIAWATKGCRSPRSPEYQGDDAKCNSFMQKCCHRTPKSHQRRLTNYELPTICCSLNHLIHGRSTEHCYKWQNRRQHCILGVAFTFRCTIHRGRQRHAVTAIQDHTAASGLHCDSLKMAII